MTDLEAEILVLRQQINVLRRRDDEATAPQQYRSFSIRLALSLVSLRPWGVCDCQAGDDYSLAPRRVSGALALAITQPRWQTDDLG
jgi:hypothetical protein